MGIPYKKAMLEINLHCIYCEKTNMSAYDIIIITFTLLRLRLDLKSCSL